MAAAPTGSVTFLFSDIEGSTKLLHELGRGGYAEVLRAHHRLLRAAWNAHGGFEVDTAGDGFLVAFAEASAALAAAAEAQRVIAPTGVRIRIGVHSGEASFDGGRYVGRAVHRAARICAAAHGGQIVLSESAAELARDADDPPALRDLGIHRLKDIEPQRLYQLVGPGLDAEFPALRSLSNTNLPPPANPLIGRDTELDAVRALIADEGRRLVTVTGPGGTGKTRFALEVAQELLGLFPDGVFFVPLAALTDAERVLEAVLEALPVREQPGRGALDLVADYLASKRVLLFVDNFEHVADAAPAIGDLLRRAPELSVLATSREPLRLESEVEFPLEPLAESGAAELFVQRVRQTLPSFEPDDPDAVAAICRRVDGLPLALELAAARVKLLGVRGLLDALERQLDVLKTERRDIPERQRTLRATIEWSFGLLTEQEQELLAALSVFADGCTLDAAIAVCDADLDVLGSLLEKSLVRRRDAGDGGVRFWLLQTIRDFALEHAGSRLAMLRDRHLEYFAALARTARPRLWSGEQLHWLRRLDSERENVRVALAHGFGPDGDTSNAARLAAAMHDYWDIRGLVREGTDWMRLALARVDTLEPLDAAAVYTATAVMVGRLGGFRDEFIECTSIAADLYRAHGDAAGETRALGLLAQWLVGDPDVAVQERGRAMVAETAAAAERAGDAVSFALAAACAAEVASFDDLAAAIAGFQEAGRRILQAGDRRNYGILMLNVAIHAIRFGDLPLAERSIDEAAGAAREVEDTLNLAYVSTLAAALRLHAGDHATAVAPLAEALRLTRQVGWSVIHPIGLTCAALIAACNDDPRRARRLLAMHDRIAAQIFWHERLRTIEDNLVERIHAAAPEPCEPPAGWTIEAAGEEALAVVEAAGVVAPAAARE
jgi:predicted ATPase/class 3 adenylate cyclase